MDIESLYERSKTNQQVQKETYILLPRDGEETSSVIGETGEKIIERIFCREYPFLDWIDRYEKWYRENILFEFIRRKLEKEEEREESES